MLHKQQLPKLSTRASSMQVDEDYQYGSDASPRASGSRSPRSPAGAACDASFSSTMIKGTNTSINQVMRPHACQ
jgi:hypothetical protein